MNYEFNFSLARTCIVISEKPVQGQLLVKLEEDYQESSFLDHPRRVSILGSNIPKKGQRCLCIFETSADDSHGYYIGKIDDTYNEKVETLNINTPLESSGKKSKITIGDSRTHLSVNNGSTQGVFDSNYSRISVKENFMHLQSDLARFGVVKDTITIGLLDVNYDNLNIFHQKQTNINTSHLDVQVRKGGVHFHGGIKEGKELETNPNEKYGFLDRFLVKAKNANFELGKGRFGVSANGMSVILGSSKLGSTIPGTGPAEAFKLDIGEGNLLAKVGVGDINLIALNYMLKDEILIKNGWPLGPWENSITLGMNNITISSVLSYVLKATTDYSKGSIESKAFQNIKMNATLGILDMHGMRFSLDSTTSGKISALSMDISSKTTLNVKGMMGNIEATTLNVTGSGTLNFSKSGMINFGPKVATPGPGPLCSIPTCPLLGIMHTGSSCV